MLIRVPVVLAGIAELIWGMDATKDEYTGTPDCSKTGFWIAVIEKAEFGLNRERATREDCIRHRMCSLGSTFLIFPSAPSKF